MRLDGIERKPQDPLGSTGSERALGRSRSRGKACVAQKLHSFQWWQSVHLPADLARPQVIGQHGLPVTVHEQVNVAGYIRGEGLLTPALPARRGQKRARQ